MLEKVKEIVAEGLDVNAADLTEETTFESLGADSLDLMDMVMTFEDEFGVEIATFEEKFKKELKREKKDS